MYTFSMTSFYQLSEQERKEQLTKMAEKAGGCWNIDIAGIEVLDLDTNALFTITDGNGRSFVLRISDPKNCHSSDELSAELLWLDALKRDPDIHIRVPIQTARGEFFVSIEHPPVPESRFVTVFDKVPGEELGKQLNEKNVREWGKLAARLHRHGGEFSLPKGLKLRSYRSILPYCQSGFEPMEPIHLDKINEAAGINDRRASTYRSVMEVLNREIDEIYKKHPNPILIHHDLHDWNVLVDGERLYAIDFEDLIYGQPILDIGVALYSISMKDECEEYIRIFKAGYSTILPWPEDYPGQLKKLFLGRRMMLVNWLLNSQVPEDREIIPQYLEKLDKAIATFLRA